MDYVGNTIKAFEKYRYKYDIRDLFFDFVHYEVGLIEAQMGNKTYYDAYKRLDNKYPDDVKALFQTTVTGLINALTEHPKDYLGEILSHFGTQKKALGQCFTPSHISELMAGFEDHREAIKGCSDKPYTVHDPCCGSGSLLLGMLYTWKKQGINYAKDTMLVAQDIDSNVAEICYLQLSLCGAAAIVNIGNSLLCEIREQYVTLAAKVQYALRQGESI